MRRILLPALGRARESLVAARRATGGSGLGVNLRSASYAGLTGAAMALKPPRNNGR